MDLRSHCLDPARVAIDERRRASIFDAAADRIIARAIGQAHLRGLDDSIAAYRSCRDRGFRCIGSIVIER